MVEISLPWSADAVGDGVLSPYDNDEWSDTWRKLFIRDRTTQGPIEGVENQLVVSNPAGTTIRVATGAALVDGKFYETDANVDNVIAAPAVSTRIDRVILRKIWGTQTVRVAILTGVEGGGVPTVTQTDGTIWEIPLAQISITTVPAITITDERDFCRSPLIAALTGAYTELETITADGSSAVIDFQSIPQTSKHLVLIGQGRMEGAILEADLQIRFNNDSGANYNDQQTKGENVTASAVSSVGANEGELGQIPAASASAGFASSIYFNIPNYTGSFFKQWLGMSIHMPNNTPSNFSMRHIGGVWEDTNPITRITLLSTTGSSGNFSNGSRYTLYGLS